MGYNEETIVDSFNGGLEPHASSVNTHRHSGCGGLSAYTCYQLRGHCYAYVLMSKMGTKVYTRFSGLEGTKLRTLDVRDGHEQS